MYVVFAVISILLFFFQLLIDLLQGETTAASLSNGGKVTAEQRNSKMSSLRSQRKELRNTSAQHLKEQRKHHVAILQEGQYLFVICYGQLKQINLK